MQGQHKILDRTWTTLALSRVLPCVELRSIHFLSQACCASHPGRLPYRRHSRSESTSKRVFRIVAYDDGTLWHKRRHLLESLLLELHPFPFILSLHGTGCSEATTTLQYVLTTGPTTEDRLSRAPHNSGSPEKKRINKAKFSKPLTFSLPPSRKRAWSVLNHRRHVTPFCCRRFLFSFHSGLWMLSTLKQSELINTSL